MEKRERDLVFDWLPVDRVDDSQPVAYSSIKRRDEKKESSSQSTCTVRPHLRAASMRSKARRHTRVVPLSLFLSLSSSLPCTTERTKPKRRSGS